MGLHHVDSRFGDCDKQTGSAKSKNIRNDLPIEKILCARSFPATNILSENLRKQESKKQIVPAADTPFVYLDGLPYNFKEMNNHQFH